MASDNTLKSILPSLRRQALPTEYLNIIQLTLILTSQPHAITKLGIINHLQQFFLIKNEYLI